MVKFWKKKRVEQGRSNTTSRKKKSNRIAAFVVGAIKSAETSKYIWGLKLLFFLVYFVTCLPCPTILSCYGFTDIFYCQTLQWRLAYEFGLSRVWIMWKLYAKIPLLEAISIQNLSVFDHSVYHRASFYNTLSAFVFASLQLFCDIFRTAGLTVGSAPRDWWAVCQLRSPTDSVDPWDRMHDENEASCTRNSASSLPQKSYYQERGR